MKKFLGIVVLGFLFSKVTFAESIDEWYQKSLKKIERDYQISLENLKNWREEEEIKLSKLLDEATEEDLSSKKIYDKFTQEAQKNGGLKNYAIKKLFNNPEKYSDWIYNSLKFKNTKRYNSIYEKKPHEFVIVCTATYPNAKITFNGNKKTLPLVTTYSFEMDGTGGSKVTIIKGPIYEDDWFTKKFKGKKGTISSKQIGQHGFLTYKISTKEFKFYYYNNDNYSSNKKLYVSIDRKTFRAFNKSKPNMNRLKCFGENRYSNALGFDREEKKYKSLAKLQKKIVDSASIIVPKIIPKVTDTAKIYEAKIFGLDENYKIKLSSNKNIFDKAQISLLAEKKEKIFNSPEQVAKRKANEERLEAEKKRLEAEKERLKAEKEKKLAKEKAERERIANEKLQKKLDLIPEKSDLDKATNYLVTVRQFIEDYPNEFDIVKIAKHLINTKPILNGIFDDKQKNDLKILKEFTETSPIFINYLNNSRKTEINKKLSEIEKIFAKLEISKEILEKKISKFPFSTYTEINLKIIEEINAAINKPNSLTQLWKLSIDTEKHIKNLNDEEERKLAKKKANEEKIAKQKRKHTSELLRAEDNIEKLKNYLQKDINSPLALTIIDHVENLEKRINQNNYKNLVLINNKVDKFIYKEYIEPAEIKAAEKKKIEEEKRKKLAKEAAERERKLIKKYMYTSACTNFRNFASQYFDSNIDLIYYPKDHMKMLVKKKDDLVLYYVINNRNSVTDPLYYCGIRTKKKYSSYEKYLKENRINIAEWYGSNGYVRNY